MATHFPPDRFDSIPDDVGRVGAHRGPVPAARKWVLFAWAALATGVLVLAGIAGLAVISDSIEFDLPFEQGAATGEATEPGAVAVTPQLDPDLPITVLNGTTTVGLAGRVGDFLEAQGWDGAALGVGARSTAASQDVVETVVVYSDSADEAAALALVETLGMGTARLGDEYPASPMTVVLGTDFEFPTG